MIHDRFNSSPRSLNLWRAFTIGVAVLSLASAGWVVGMGLSSFRLALAVVFTLVGLLALAGAVQTWLRPASADRLWSHLAARLNTRRGWNIAFILSSILLYLGLTLAATYPDLQEPFLVGIFSRLLPLGAWLAGMCLLVLGLLLALRHAQDIWAMRPHGRFFYLLLVYYAAVLLGWSWVTRTILASESQRLGWNHLGTPIVGWQLALAGLAGLALLLFYAWQARRPQHMGGRGLDVLLALLIWGVAVLLWQSTPMPPNWFVTKPVAPNFEYYPSSDARAYDTSGQTALIGQGYRFYDSIYVRRSLLATWITLFHVAGGQDYDRVVWVQILLLALIPVLLYFIGRSLLNRPAGLIAAVLMLLRQTNAIAVADTITTSNAKLIMADLPSTLMALAFTLVAILWLKRLKDGLHPALALATGGVLGLAMLIRMEMMVFSLAVALAAAFLLLPRKQWGRLVSGGLLCVLGVSLALGPWVYRNYRLTGQVFIDSPYFSLALLVQRFYPGGNPMQNLVEPQDEDQAPPPDEAPAPKVQPMLAPPQAQAPVPTPQPPVPQEVLEKAQEQTVTYMMQNMGKIAGQGAAHILNSQMQAFLYLPNTYRGLDSLATFAAQRSPADYWLACCSVAGLPRRLPFWRQWDGQMPSQVFLPLALNLLLIAYGANLSWKRWRWAGIMPMMMAFIFIVFNGVLRNSGGRYLLPVDWVSMLYLAMGMAEATRRGLGYLTGKAIPFSLPGEADPLALPTSTGRAQLGATILVGAALLVFAAGVPLIESSFPLRYTPERQQTMLQSALTSNNLDEAQRQALQTYLQNGAVVMSGRALYPRYFPPNVGDDAGKKSPLSPRPYPRMVFYLAGERNLNVMLPLEGKPRAFPNALDALVIACPERDLLATFLFSPTGELREILLRAPFPQQMTCPLPQDRQ